VSEAVPASLLAALKALTESLQAAGIPAIVVGGVAASLLGRPRLTRDIDALVDLSEDRWPDVLSAVRSFSIEPRIDDTLGFARRTRVLLLRHVPSQIDIDVIFGGLPFERDAVTTGQTHSLGRFDIRLPRVEDLMIMKAVAQRPRDVMDLEALLDTHPEANLDRVRQWVREFSTAAAMPDLLAGFDKLVARARSRR
jgi:hypothetical protein